MAVDFKRHDKGYILASDSMRDVETVTAMFQIKTGSRNEEYADNGLSHFLEHMAFKGTKTRTALQIAQEFDAIGGYFNAYTSRERTVYYAKVLKDDLPIALDILSDILQNSIYAEDEIKREKEVILQEIAQTNDAPDDLIFDMFQEKAYPDQSFGRSILGTVEHVSNVTQKQLLSYVDRNHFNENLVISTAGKITFDHLQMLLDERFSGFNAKDSKFTNKADYLGGEIRQNKDLEQVHIVFGFKCVDFYHDDFYAYQVLSIIAGGGMSSRLFQEIRERRGLVYSVSSFSSHYTDTGMFGVYGATTPENANEFLTVAIEELKKMIDNISDDELMRAKSQVRASLLMGQESTVARAEKLGHFISAFNRYISVDEVLEEIAKIDKKRLSACLKELLMQKSLPTLASIGKTDKLIQYEKFIELVKG